MPKHTYLFLLLIFSFQPLQAQEAPPKVWPRKTAVVQAVKKSGAAIVSIQAERIIEVRNRSAFRDPFFDDFFNDFSGTRKRKAQSQGSGVILNEEGFLITNHHVINGASKITVTLKGQKKSLIATVIADDPGNDLAILKIKSKKKLPAIKVGKSSDLMIGETVIALGNPFGLSNTVTVGVVSAVKRSIYNKAGKEAYKSLIQTDAAINPGNSGGALMNINGELIGMNTAIYAKGQGLGFAIPVDHIKKVMVNLMNVRYPNDTWLGVAWKLNKGRLQVSSVEKGSPAQKSGIKSGDELKAIGGRAIDDVLGLWSILLAKQVGDSIKFKFKRNKAEIKLSLVLLKLPATEGEKLIEKKLGIKVRLLSVAEAKKLGVQGRFLLITKVTEGSSADNAGLKSGDMISGFGQIRIDSVGTFAKILRHTEKDAKYLIRIVRNKGFLEGAIKIRD